MDIKTFIDIFETNPALYFIAGLVAGYLLRVYMAEFTSKKPGRYQTKTTVAAKRSDFTAEFEEPSVDWPVAAIKRVTSARVGTVSLEQQGNEFQ